MLDFFSDGKKSEWRNRLIWGDKKYVLPSLLEEFAGKVNLIITVVLEIVFPRVIKTGVYL